nr:unnamed protein product [Digitaria exilis]
MERIPAASAMDWSIDLDRGLRSRHHGNSSAPLLPFNFPLPSVPSLTSAPRPAAAATRVGALDAAAPRLRQLCACAASPAPAPVASAYGVLPGEARVFAETMLLRLATEFRTAADGAMRARVVRTLLAAAGGRGVLVGARVAEPEQLLRRVKVVYDTGSARDKALALRVFGCLAEVAEDSVHVRSLILSSLGASSALEVGKQMVLGSLEDVFKSEMLYSLSRLTSAALEELRASNGNVELLATSAKACLIESDIEPGKLPKRFSHASVLQDLLGRVDGPDRQIVSQLQQFMPASFDAEYIRRDLTKGRDEKDSQSDLEMVTSFASFEPADSGQRFSACLLDVSSFPEGSYQIKWHACCVNEKGSYFSLLPLNDGAVFSVRKS